MTDEVPLGPAPERRVIAHADGASLGNPGHAGAGYVLLEPSGVEIERGQQYLGETTNNEAEYEALLLALRAAYRLQATHVTVRMDSQLVIKQMRGEYRVRNARLKPLHDNVRRAFPYFVQIRFEHVPREQNAVADGLAGTAAKGRGSVN